LAAEEAAEARPEADALTSGDEGAVTETVAPPPTVPDEDDALPEPPQPARARAARAVDAASRAGGRVIFPPGVIG
jgi:polygalacturonase